MGLMLGSVTASAIALVFVLWAGLLLMAEHSPSAIGSVAVSPDVIRRENRRIHICRFSLFSLSGIAAAEAVGWWHHQPLPGVGRALLALLLLYLIGEGIPRSVTVILPKVSVAMAPVARKTILPFAPIDSLTGAMETLALSLFPARERSVERFGKEHRDMLEGAFSLDETTVAEVMTPRLDILAVESSANWHDLVDLLRRGEHVKIVVYTEDLDDVVGVLYAKDVTSAIAGVEDPPADWREKVKPAQFVPESKRLTAQLRDFQRSHSSLAIVVDEYGGTSGLITLEDVLEEVVGEIHGEFDSLGESQVEREGEDRFWVEGILPLDDLSDLLGSEIEREDVTTVGGLVYSELGHVPKPGEELQLEGFRVVVEQVVRRRIMRVYFERLMPADSSNHRAGNS